jgi:hypothetical protein
MLLVGNSHRRHGRVQAGLQACYRHLDVNYRPSSGFIYNTATSGLLLGATINIK